MFINRFCLLFVGLFQVLVCTLARSQSVDSIYESSIIKIANTAVNETYLTPYEKEIILLINLARLDGKTFGDKIVIPYLKNNNEGFNENSPEIISLLKDLNSIKNQACLLPQRTLFEIANTHASRMGKLGKIGHDGYQKRFKNFKGATGENCSYGFNEPLLILMQLLIDKDVPNRGHRKNILGLDATSKQFTHIGIAIKPHKVWSYNCVMDFAKID